MEKCCNAGKPPAVLKLESARIGFIGAGNMAQAIGQGLFSKGLVAPSQVIVSAPSERSFASWKELGVETTNSNAKVVDVSDIIFLAMKPQFLDAALETMKAFQHPVASKLYVSILVGTLTETLEMKLRAVVGNVRVIRAMPNTPMLVGEGCCVFCPGKDATENDKEIVQAMLSSAGLCQMVPESMMNAIGGIAGSGPAYIYLVIEALSDGAVKQGVPRAMATVFAAQTVLGAGKMVLQTGRHPGQLKDEVCSPGGSTIHGVHALERSGVRCAFMDAIEAAAKKSAEFSAKK